MSAEPGGGLRVTWLGHSTVAIDLGGMRLLTDPLLRRRAGPLVRSAALPEPRLWNDPDAVLLSHLHHDHADLTSLRRLGGAPVVTGRANRAWAARCGLSLAWPDEPRAPHHAGGADDEWWTVPRPTGGGSGGELVGVRLVRAVHESRPMPHRPNAANGFLVRGPESVVYFAGDTALFDDMSDLASLAGGTIDLALLPIGGWGPRLSEGHLGPATAAEAALRLGARVVMPVHYGTLHPWGWPRPLLGWMQEPLSHFAHALRERAPDAVLLAPPPGQPTMVPPRPLAAADSP